jgi:nucleoside 2-deoxyribosyltransferase
MTHDPWDNDDARAWAEHVLAEVVPKIQESSAVISLWPSGEVPDAKLAVETGYAILLGKPIIVVAAPDVKLPATLEAVARTVVRWNGHERPEALVEALQAVMEEDA